MKNPFDNDTGITSGGIIVVTGRADTDISSIFDYLSKATEASIITINDLTNSIHKAFTTLPKQINLFLVNEKYYELSCDTIKKKVYCYFLSFVLFLVAFKGILPHPCRDIRNDETPYGFG